MNALPPLEEKYGVLIFYLFMDPTNHKKCSYKFAVLVTLTSTEQDLTLCTNLSSDLINCNIVSLQDARDTVDWS